MSQNDYTIANQGFPAFRADLNSALQAIATNNSGDTEPSTMFANMWWYDSANNILYIRNEDNDAWIKFAELDQTNDKFILSGTLQLDDGTVSAPALTFNSDTNMGLYRGGTDILKFVTAGADRVTIDASGNVGINTSSPTAGYMLHVGGSSGVHTKVKIEATTATGQAELDLSADPAGVSYLNLGDEDSHNIGYLGYFHSDNSMRFQTNSAERMRIDASGKVGISDSSPSSKLTVGGSATTTAKPTVAIVDTTSGATMTMRGQSPKIAFDVTASGVPKILMDNAGLEFKTGTLDAEGDVDVKIDSSGNVGIGTSSPSQLLEINGASNPAFLIKDTTNNCITYMYSQDSVATMGSASNHPVVFNVNNGEKVRIDTSGNVLVGATTAEGTGVTIASPESGGSFLTTSNTSARNHIRFKNPNGVVGSIQTSGSATTYATSSDYRLKENVVTDWDATTRLKQLKPSRFNFIADADTTVDGFIAHEVQAIVPEAISGTKDAVDADGNAVMQGIDQSKLVPLLVKTIQELEARITTLENGA